MNYLPEDQRCRLSAPGKLKNVSYIYTEQEADEHFYASIHYANALISLLKDLLNIEANLSFAIVNSTKPFQAARIGDKEYVILIQQDVCYFLLPLCLRLQTLPPLSKVTDSEEIAEPRDYRGKYLLDITRDMAFNAHSTEYLKFSSQQNMIYQAAFGYIIGHEVAHIIHGHLDFINSTDFEQFTDNQDDENLTLRTLEMDADSSATTSVAGIFETLLHTKIAEKSVLETFDVAEYKSIVRKSYILGIYIAHIFHDTLSNDFNPKKYPLSYSRFLNSYGVLEKYLTAKAPEALGFLEEVRQLLVECFVNLSGHIGNLGYPIASNMMFFNPGSDQPMYIYSDIGEAIALQDLEPLFYRWARLRPILMKYRCGGSLAPAQYFPH